MKAVCADMNTNGEQVKREAEEKDDSISRRAPSVNTSPLPNEWSSAWAQVDPSLLLEQSALRSLKEDFSLLLAVWIGIRPSQTFAGGLAIL